MIYWKILVRWNFIMDNNFFKVLMLKYLIFKVWIRSCLFHFTLWITNIRSVWWIAITSLLCYIEVRMFWILRCLLIYGRVLNLFQHLIMFSIIYNDVRKHSWKINIIGSLKSKWDIIYSFILLTFQTVRMLFGKL